MPSESDLLYTNSCWGCGRRFKPGQVVYSESPYGGEVFVYCEECFAKALMLRLDEWRPDAWTLPFRRVYNHLFPNEDNFDRYFRPLQRAMTTLFLRGEKDDGKL